MKKENAVTLVALVITIIVLLVLAGITISLTVGQDGIITKAQQAGKNYLNAQEYEELQIAELTNEMQNILNNGTGERNAYDESSFRTSVIKAIEDAGVDTPDNATDEIIIDNIGKILIEGTSANATPEDIAEGKTAWANGKLITGTHEESSLDIDFTKYAYETWSGNKNTTKTITVSGTPILIVTGGCYDLDNSGGSRNRNLVGIYDATQGVGIGSHKVSNIDFDTGTVTLSGSGNYTGYYATYVLYK